MGGTLSRLTQRKVNLSHANYVKLRYMMAALRLTAGDVLKLHGAFKKLDVDGSDNISQDELFNYLELEPTEFYTRIFSTFDAQVKHNLNLVEFIAGVFNFCTYSRDNLATYVFQMFDGNTGAVELSALLKLGKYVNGGHELDARAKASLDHADVSFSGSITLEEFIVRMRLNPGLLGPAFKLQETMHTRIVTASWWKRQMDRVLTEKLDVLGSVQLMADEFSAGELSHLDDGVEEGDGDCDASDDESGGSSSPSSTASSASRLRQLQSDIAYDGGGKIVLQKDSLAAQRSRQSSIMRMQHEGDPDRKSKAPELLYDACANEDFAIPEPALEPTLVTFRPKRAKGEGPGIKCQSPTYSRLINERKYESFRVEKGKRDALTKGASMGISRSSKGGLRRCSSGTIAPAG